MIRYLTTKTSISTTKHTPLKRRHTSRPHKLIPTPPNSITTLRTPSQIQNTPRLSLSLSSHRTTKRNYNIFSRQAATANERYNRWWAVPGTFLIQLSVGSVYAWSIFNEPLIRHIGVISSAAEDWALGSVIPVFSLAAVSFGFCTWFLGPWVEKHGTRAGASLAAFFWGSGLVLSALACYLHSLPLLYFGYGVLGGMGWGLGYISPVSTLIKWFPDRKGLATGLAVAAFGGGALIAAPLNEFFLKKYFQSPTYLGTHDAVELITVQGKRFTEIAGQLKEVLVVNSHEIANFPGLSEGVYLIGTGNSGLTYTFLSLAAVHVTSMLTGAFMVRLPKEGWAPPGFVPKPLDSTQLSGGSVDYKQALKTPQYYLFLASIVGFSIAGVSIISCAKTIMADVFGRAMPAIVTGSFTALYVAALSAANMSGRFLWGFGSDWIGRRKTYFVFGLALPIALMIPVLTGYVSAGAATVPILITFYVSTFFLVSFYGGIFGVLPAYISDIFGPKNVGSIHGRLLPAWSFSALTGPTLLSGLRTYSYNKEVRLLAEQVDPVAFEHEFDSPISNLEALLEAKTVTINRLMEIAPPGTIDPTPLLYNTTIYCMCILLVVAIGANYQMKAVDRKHITH